MSLINKKNKFLLIVLMAMGLLVVACNPSAEKLNQEGNQAFAEQAYLEALEDFQSAQIASPELAEPYYNAANALYRQGKYAEALEQLGQALNYVEEETLAEHSFYNLGNNFFNSQELETAIEAYKQALLLNPEDQDAKYNLELALQQQQQQEQQDQQQQEQSEEEQNQEENQDQNQNGENQDEQEQEQGGDQSENQNEQDQEQQGDQSENQDQQNEGERQEDQRQNDGNSQPQDGEKQEEEGQQPGQMPHPGQRMTEEQAKQLLAALAQDMETLQERLGQILFVSKPPPVQDW